MALGPQFANPGLKSNISKDTLCERSLSKRNIILMMRIAAMYCHFSSYVKGLNLEKFLFSLVVTHRGWKDHPFFVDGETEAWEYTVNAPRPRSKDLNPRNLTPDRDVRWASLSNRLD